MPTGAGVRAPRMQATAGRAATARRAPAATAATAVRQPARPPATSPAPVVAVVRAAQATDNPGRTDNGICPAIRIGDCGTPGGAAGSGGTDETALLAY